MTELTGRLTTALAGRYQIERHLGQGGMAIVYLATDLKHDRKVALKVLRPALSAVVGADRFLSEIKTTANLQHPHILTLHDSGDTLFSGPYLSYNHAPQWDLSSNGTFVLLRSGAQDAEIVVVMNSMQEVRARLGPTGR